MPELTKVENNGDRSAVPSKVENNLTKAAAVPLYSKPAFATGVDIERVAEFTLSSDPHRDEFITSTFTDAEISYCLIQDNPAQHLAARFCAKEALIKCSPELIDVPFNRIELARSPKGAPYFYLLEEDVVLENVSVSLAHTSETAVAFVVKFKTHSDRSS
jgi:holo-[acyl-carrier protein] synthase